MVLNIKTNWILYCSYSLSRWGDRMFSFAIGIFLIHLHPQSLLVTALYSFMVKFSCVCLTGSIGNKIDHTPRITAMRLSLIIQNSSVALSSILIMVAFELNISYSCSRALFFLIIFLITIFGIISSLSSAATSIIMERDWIVVMTLGDPDKLSTINAAMRRIDQICLLLAPIIAGLFVSLLSATWASALIAVWNIGSFFAEYSLLAVVYRRVPDLAKEKEKGVNREEENIHNNISYLKKISNAFADYVGNVRVFFNQPIALIGICLSILYLTVLGWGPITVAYLRLNRVKDMYVGFGMAGGAVFGILGTLFYAPVTKKYDASTSGAFGACALIVSIIVASSSVYFENSVFVTTTNVTNSTGTYCNQLSEEMLDVSGNVELPTVLLLVGIITLRFGLWTYDLAISQQFQQLVPESQRNTVGGVQRSFNDFFDCVAIILTIFISNPKNFDILIIISCVAVTASCIIYLLWYVRRSLDMTPDAAPAVQDVQYNDLPAFSPLDDDEIEDYDLAISKTPENFEQIDLLSDNENNDPKI